MRKSKEALVYFCATDVSGMSVLLRYLTIGVASRFSGSEGGIIAALRSCTKLIIIMPQIATIYFKVSVTIHMVVKM